MLQKLYILGMQNYGLGPLILKKTPQNCQDVITFDNQHIVANFFIKDWHIKAGFVLFYFCAESGRTQIFR